MSVKAVFKDHISQSPISRHLTSHFTNKKVDSHHFIYKKSILSHFSHRNDANNIELNVDFEKLKIRKFNHDDLDKCAELYLKVFTADPWYDGWLSSDQVRYYLTELIDNPVYEGFVAFEDFTIVAVCFGHTRSFWTGKEFFIDEFYVENDKQGNGIGTKFLNLINDRLVKEDYRRLILLTNKGIPAEQFYVKNGFYNQQNRTIMFKEL